MNEDKIQKEALRSLIDNSVMLAKDRLHGSEAFVVSGVLQGKSLIEIGGELGLTSERVRQISHEAMPKFLSQLDYSDLREENNELRKMNDLLQKEVDSLRERVSVLGVARKIEGTPFTLELAKFGFPVRLVNILYKVGCKNLADLVRLDATTLINRHKLSKSTMQNIERVLESIGLRLGMNLDSMSDDDFSSLVARLTKQTGYNPQTMQKIVKDNYERIKGKNSNE